MTPLRIVVFGGSGFIGTRLVARLVRAGHEVRIADKQPSQAFPELRVACNVRNLDETIKASEGMDVVINLAAEHVDDVSPFELYYQTNVEGAENVCKAADANGIRRMIFTSTVAVYGMPDGELDETAPLNPFNEYGRTKVLAEEVYHKWAAVSEDRRLTIVRPTVVFGEGNRCNFYHFLCQMDSGKFMMVGNGRNRKSIAYVENVAAFLEFALTFDTRDETYNYVDPHDMDMNEFVPLVNSFYGRPAKIGRRLPYWLGYGIGRCFDLLAWLTRRKMTISAIRVKKFCGSTLFSARKAMATGFKPPVDVREGLAQTIRAEFIDKTARPTCGLLGPKQD
ncbi:MAG: NAD-dependent epimerase/dehydratase family protein [Pirellulales bacterium]|nr:NAD-dependent epimerase/dehydratase family protein [Pirellulales bacterium]